MQEYPCKYRKFETFYECSISYQTITNGNVTLKGLHERGKLNRDVDNLNFYRCDFTGFPRNLQEIYPNVKRFCLNGCKVANLTREDFGKWAEMEHFAITQSNVRTVNGDLLKDFKELKSVSLRDNKIEEISPSFFEGCDKLTFVDLRGNVNIDMLFDLDRRIGSMERINREIRLRCQPNSSGGGKELQERITILERKNRQLESTLKTHEKTLEKLEKMFVKFYDLQQAFIDDTLFKDFTIVVDGVSFNVHKALFAARCPKISELLQSNTSAEELKLNGIKPSAFTVIYDFIYKNQLPDEKANYLEIFTAASHLKVEPLAEIAADQLLKRIDDKNSFEVLVVSNVFDNEQLRMRAFENIRTKVFPDRVLDNELARQPERLRKPIEMKRRMDKELALF